MKILFFISAVKHGKGGHSHSLNVISREIAKNAEVQICGIGAGRSYILEQNPYFKKDHQYEWDSRPEIPERTESSDQ